MVKVCIPFRLAVQIGVVLAILSAATMGFAQCVGIHEEGRWRNLDPKGDPSYIDVKTVGGCGDVSYNGQPAGSAMHYTMRVWVKQSSGKFYGRPPVKAVFLVSKGQKWLRGDVPTGGYVDQMWVRVEQRDGRPQLHALIRHQSLDSKPSSNSEYWYSK
jgi:hypothetical protein